MTLEPMLEEASTEATTVADRTKGNATNVADKVPAEPGDLRAAGRRATDPTIEETLFHSEPWRTSVVESFGVEIETFVPSTEPLGKAYYSVLDDIRGPRVVCTPCSDFCDPMLGARGWTEFVDHLRSLGLPITIRPFRHPNAVSDERFELRRELLWHGVDLSAGADAIWDGLKSKVRTGVRRANRAGALSFRLSSDPVDIETFHAMHVDLRKSKYRLLAQPLSFFMTLHENFDNDMAVLLAEENGEAVAAMVFFAWNGVWYYKFGASYPRERRPNGALIMEACRHGAERGLHLLDMGRSDKDQPGLIQFKQQFASTELELTTLHWTPEDHSDPRGAAVGRELEAITSLLTEPAAPNEIAAQGGELLYRYFA